MKKIIYTLFIFPLFIFAQELSVASGGTLTISTTGSMTVSSTINVNINGSLIIETSRTALLNDVCFKSHRDACRGARPDTNDG